MAQFKAGIIGCGRPWQTTGATGFGMGHLHAAGYEASPDAELVAAADIDEQNLTAFCQEHAVPHGYSSADEMLAQESLDIVSICLWPHLHAPMVCKVAAAAAVAGVKAIHCEKPMALTFGDAKKMVEVCDANGVLLTFNHMRRFGKPFRKAKELLDSGAIGELERVEAFTSNLYDWGTHWFDMMFFYNDETPVEWVIGQIDARGGLPIFGAMVEGQGLSMFKWKNGVAGLMVTGYQGDEQSEPLKSRDCENRLVGSEGVIEVGLNTGSQIRLRSAATGGQWEIIETGSGIHGKELHVAGVLDLIDALKTGREPELAGRRALQATELIFATYESSRRRGRVDLPLDIEDSPYLAMLNTADMTTWPAFDITVNGVKLHYHRTGGDKPPLVLCHGFSDNGLCWTPVARVLEKEYDVIMVDARGHGLSDAPETGYTAAHHAEDIAGLIQALGLEKPIVMGHSMGASTTATVAAKHPDLVSKAILEDPPWFEKSQIPPAPADPDAMLEQRRAEIVERGKLSRETLMAQGREQSPTWAEAELGPWAESKRQLHPNVVGLFGKRAPWQGIVPQIACPTLLITADAEKAIVTPKTAQQAQALNANIQTVHIEGAGHNIRREAFEPFIQAVKAFLAES